MHFIRKFAIPLAVLSALLLAVASPYMIPENPDSAIFRSGTLGNLLIAACAYPAYLAFSRAQRRTLVCSLSLGLLFALALSVGSELFIYEGLLPGFGSLLRRLAVPVLATPMLGALISLALDAKPLRTGNARIPYWVYALILFLCWLPLLLAFYPGMLNYDFEGQYHQHTMQAYSNIHPLFYSAVSNAIIALGTAIADPTLGVLLLSLIQMALFAMALGYACAFVQRRGAPVPVLLCVTAFFALHPVFSVMSVSMTKDTLFAAAVLVLSLKAWALIEDPQAFFERRHNGLLFVLMAVCTVLTRNNGVFALAFLYPALLLLLRSVRKRILLLCAATLAGCAAIMGVLTLALNPETLPSFQLYSIPAQQLVRAYNSDTMSETDKADIRAWYTDDLGLEIIPHLGDRAKGYLDRPRIQREGEAFLALWTKHAGTYAHEYLEAFLMLNVGSWYPDDLSHSTIYPDASYNDKGYLQLSEYDMRDDGIVSTSYLPAVRNLYERICRRNYYQKYPVVALLFCTATPFWGLLLACARLIAKRRTRMLPAALGALGLWLFYLLGPCTLPRYALPLFCLAPVLLALAYLPQGNPPHDIRFAAKEREHT